TSSVSTLLSRNPPVIGAAGSSPAMIFSIVFEFIFVTPEFRLEVYPPMYSYRALQDRLSCVTQYEPQAAYRCQHALVVLGIEAFRHMEVVFRTADDFSYVQILWPIV